MEKLWRLAIAGSQCRECNFILSRFSRPMAEKFWRDSSCLHQNLPNASQIASRMKAPIKFLGFWPPLLLLQGERIACRAVALRRREVRGSEAARPLKPQTLTLPSPFGRERRLNGPM